MCTQRSENRKLPPIVVDREFKNRNTHETAWNYVTTQVYEDV
jgi:hypothetical protein